MVKPWMTAHPEVILGSTGEFETCPDWGTRLGHGSVVPIDQSENKTGPMVRSQGQLGDQSSKRVHDGEPNSPPLCPFGAFRLSPVFPSSGSEWRPKSSF